MIAVIIRIRGKVFQNAGQNSLHSQHASTVVYYREKKKWSHTFSPLVLFLSRMQIPSDWTSLKGLCEFVSAARLGCPAEEPVLSVSNFIASAAAALRHGETDGPVSLTEEPVCVSFCLLY